MNLAERQLPSMNINNIINNADATPDPQPLTTTTTTTTTTPKSPRQPFFRRNSTARVPQLVHASPSSKRSSFGTSSSGSGPKTPSGQKREPWKIVLRAAEIPEIISKRDPVRSMTPCWEKKDNPMPISPHKRPWLPVTKSPGIPSPAPVHKAMPTDFEKKMNQVLAKMRIIDSDPKLHYTNFKQIGSGANGAVIRAAKRTDPNNRLAIKRCRIDDDDTRHQMYVLRELKIMGLGHKNLISLKEVAWWKNEVWMGMDLMGCSVFGLLCKVSNGMPEDLVVYSVRECLKGLGFLHSKGYIHRDVKCENILVGANGEVKLADFGLAARSNRPNSSRLGTAKWMAPEVVRQQVYTDTVDLWSLGITIIEMMDRVPPRYYIDVEEEIFTAILAEVAPTFTFAYPSVYMRGLVAWVLDEDGSTRPSAKEVLVELDNHIARRYLVSATAEQMAVFVERLVGKK